MISISVPKTLLHVSDVCFSLGLQFAYYLPSHKDKATARL